MSQRSKRKLRGAVDGDLLRQLQGAVAGGEVGEASEPLRVAGPEVEEDSSPKPSPAEPVTKFAYSGESDAPVAKAAAISRRTTISVPRSVGERARKAGMALTVSEHRVITLGETLDRALELLEKALSR